MFVNALFFNAFGIIIDIENIIEEIKDPRSA